MGSQKSAKQKMGPRKAVLWLCGEREAAEAPQWGSPQNAEHFVGEETVRLSRGPRKAPFSFVGKGGAVDAPKRGPRKNAEHFVGGGGETK